MVAEDPGGVLTGRSFLSVRLDAKDIADRWERVSRPFLHQRKLCGTRLTGMGKKHSSEAFFGCNGALEAVLFSTLLELQKLQDGGKTGVDP
jgi:hypothetical protein